MSIQPDQIPQEVVEAAARMLCKEDGRIPDAVVGEDGMRGFRAWENYKPKARAAIAAGIAAWPGMDKKQPDETLILANIAAAIILPLET